jgi:hypothetical protein
MASHARLIHKQFGSLPPTGEWMLSWGGPA